MIGYKRALLVLLNVLFATSEPVNYRGAALQNPPPQIPVVPSEYRIEYDIPPANTVPSEFEIAPKSFQSNCDVPQSSFSFPPPPPPSPQSEFIILPSSTPAPPAPPPPPPPFKIEALEQPAFFIPANKPKVDYVESAPLPPARSPPPFPVFIPQSVSPLGPSNTGAPLSPPPPPPPVPSLQYPPSVAFPSQPSPPPPPQSPSPASIANLAPPPPPSPAPVFASPPRPPPPSFIPFDDECDNNRDVAIQPSAYYPLSPQPSPAPNADFPPPPPPSPASVFPLPARSPPSSFIPIDDDYDRNGDVAVQAPAYYPPPPSSAVSFAPSPPPPLPQSYEEIVIIPSSQYVPPPSPVRSPQSLPSQALVPALPSSPPLSQECVFDEQSQSQIYAPYLPPGGYPYPGIQNRLPYPTVFVK